MKVKILLLLFLVFASAALYGCAAGNYDKGASYAVSDYDYHFGYGYWGSPNYTGFPYYPYGSWGGVNRDFGYFGTGQGSALQQRHEEMERGEAGVMEELRTGELGSLRSEGLSGCGTLSLDRLRDYCNHIK